ncbi:hypothetical protein J2S13_001609 [Oikeobacillus pervagus]|uniref:YugN-like family protein n=1 Tax=Oikeobacillus pervagus TaxID=1325931 RepID=A0AAJ1SYL9_9BACI|nr:YugN family protein [Oikeobacillus pervagus]MDQ0215209.1 hypothetical protein [Oikeobacillus pervagus]
MRFENTGLEDIKIDLQTLDHAMKSHQLIRAGQWDYERVTYDRKIQIKNDIYYLRIQGYAIEGNVDSRHATIQLITPILGKHYYPHGVEYGEDENFPSQLVKTCESVIESVKKELQQLAQ